MPVTVQHNPNVTQPNGTALVDYVQRYTLGFADFGTGDSAHIPIEAGEEILGLRLHVATAFDVASTIIIGDSSDADGYLVSGQLDPTVLGARKNTLGLGAEDGVSGVTTPNAFAEGKKYTAKDYLVIDLNGNPTVGSLVVDVMKSGYGHGFERGQVNNTGLS